MNPASEPADDLEALQTKLSAARTRLILEKPFLGALVMHLELKAVDPSVCRSTGTDARYFYYNPSFIRHLSPTRPCIVRSPIPPAGSTGRSNAGMWPATMR